MAADGARPDGPDDPGRAVEGNADRLTGAGGSDPGADGAAGAGPGDAGRETEDPVGRGEDAAGTTETDAADEGDRAGGDPSSGGGDPPSGGGVSARPAVAEVEIAGASGELRVGGTVSLEATALDRDGNAIPGVAAFEWMSSDAGVATVSSDGTVAARRPGTATISVTVGGRGDEVTLTVLAAAASSVSVEPASLRMVVGDREQLSAEVLGPESEPLTGRDVTWTSGAREVATVDVDGVVRAVGAGTATVTAAVDGRSAEVDVRVVLDARSAADELVAAYARGLEAGDVAAIRRIYPEMSREEIDSFEALSELEELRVTLVVEAFEPRGDAATAGVRGTYEFNDPARGETRLDVRFTATFRVATDGWVISSWTPEDDGL